VKPSRNSLLDGLSQKAKSPAFRQIQQLAADVATELDSSAPLQTADQVLSIWSIRLWNATLRGRRFVGLAECVREMMKLNPEAKIEQLSLRNGPKVGLVFFDAKTKLPIGAVLSVRSEMDERRSRENLAVANSIYFPKVSANAFAR
jgi:hypothetical protein